jgi:hypothetical protein
MKKLEELIGAENFAALDTFVRCRYGEIRNGDLKAALVTLVEYWPVGDSYLHAARYPVGGGSDWVMAVKVDRDRDRGWIEVWNGREGWL